MFGYFWAVIIKLFEKENYVRYFLNSLIVA